MFPEKYNLGLFKARVDRHFRQTRITVGHIILNLKVLMWISRVNWIWPFTLRVFIWSYRILLIIFRFPSCPISSTYVLKKELICAFRYIVYEIIQDMNRHFKQELFIY